MKLFISAKQYISRLFNDGILSIPDLFILFLTSFISGNLIVAVQGPFNDLTYVRALSAASFWIVFTVTLALLSFTVLCFKTTLFLNWALLISSLCYAITLCTTITNQIYFNIGVALVLLFIMKYLTAENRLGLQGITVSEKQGYIITAVLFVIFTAVVSICTVIKYYCFAHATFDFGIFCQMYEQMAKTGLPFTTVERSEYLSHFAVHFSPVYYLLLPGYMIFRSPVYLLIMQAAVVGLGVFPLRRICLKVGMSPAISVLVCAVYVLFPTMANGCFYDFHENKFLSVFILYLVYFILCEKNWGILLFTFLTLSVKEDAAIYVMAVAVWMLLTSKKKLTSVFIFLISVVYFVFACNMIQLCGGEIMMSRLDNYYIDEDGGFLDVIRTCFYDIGFLIKEVFLGANTERFSEMTYGGQKIEFVLWLFIPLMFAPFAAKRTTQLTLLIPLLVINLMPEWMYQHNVDYQYTYGTAALAIASAALSFSEMKAETRKRLLLCAIVISTVFSASLVYPKANRYFVRYRELGEEYSETREALSTIPTDASVTAYGFFVPAIAYIDDLHTSPDYYAPYEQTDYFVIDTRYMGDSHTTRMIDTMGDDYELFREGGYAQIYKKTTDEN
ncbi:MAG: DUF2079 domain-containing protein [Clostridia bacterium]|nr:DUF2079 domain-containing protein [Clostridia bacterium]